MQLSHKYHLPLFAAIATLWSSNCLAELVEVDLDMPGDGLLTYDLDSGFLWLDLTETIGLSFAHVSTALELGGSLERFRYATVDEVRAFFVSAAIPQIDGPPTGANFAPVEALKALVGVTRVAINCNGSQGIVATKAENFAPSSRWVPRVCTVDGSSLADTTATRIIDTESSPTTGSWLILENQMSCTGFEPPMQEPVRVGRSRRVMPLKMRIFDRSGKVVTDADIEASPIVQVKFIGSSSSEVPVEEILSTGRGDSGNQFVFGGDRWHFNLSSKGFSQAGLYRVEAVSGDPGEYTIRPSCEAEFVIE